MLFKELMKVTVMTSTLGGGGGGCVCIAKSEQITSKKDRTDNKILDIPGQHGKSKLLKYHIVITAVCVPLVAVTATAFPRGVSVSSS